MPRKKSTAKILSSEAVFHSRVFDVQREKVAEPNGVTATRDIIVHPGSVVVLPAFADGRILLIRQYRHSVKQYLWELVAGRRDGDESFIARRASGIAGRNGLYGAEHAAAAGRVSQSWLSAGEHGDIPGAGAEERRGESGAGRKNHAADFFVARGVAVDTERKNLRREDRGGNFVLREICCEEKLNGA